MEVDAKKGEQTGASGLGLYNHYNEQDIRLRI